MKLIYGVLILGITIFFIYDIYRDGKYSKLLKSWTKYYKMAGIGFAGISLLLYFLFEHFCSKRSNFAWAIIRWLLEAKPHRLKND